MLHHLKLISLMAGGRTVTGRIETYSCVRKIPRRQQLVKLRADPFRRRGHATRRAHPSPPQPTPMIDFCLLLQDFLETLKKGSPPVI